MQKVIYALWRDAGVPQPEFNALLQRDVAPGLVTAGARGVQLNLSDAAVEAAARVRQASIHPQMEAFAQIWVDSALDRFRKPFDELVLRASSRIAAYLVNESVPIRNERHPPVPGRRTEGFAQMALFAKPARLTHEAWLEIWQRDHTGVAIDTQDNFLYVQNVVSRALTYGAPPVDAIVEECFPREAMADPMAFFDAPGDPAAYERNLKIMMDSCQRFIDFDKIDVIPTSQFVIKPPAA